MGWATKYIPFGPSVSASRNVAKKKNEYRIIGPSLAAVGVFTFLRSKTHQIMKYEKWWRSWNLNQICFFPYGIIPFKKTMEGPWLSIKRPKELWPAGCDLSTDAKYLCLGIPGGSQNWNSGTNIYHLVMTNITMENHHFEWENSL